jgi:hypothetical protein
MKYFKCYDFLSVDEWNMLHVMKRNFKFLALSFHALAVVSLFSYLLSHSSPSTPSSPTMDMITLVCMERNLLILEPCHCCSARNS